MRASRDNLQTGATRIGVALFVLPLVAGCATVAPRSAGEPHVFAAGQPLRYEARTGCESRVVVFVANDGGWPVLIHGLTPMAPTDDPVSFVERAHGSVRYDAGDGRITVAPVAGAEEQHVTVHRGLLLPGEATQIYASVVPLHPGESVHRYRLDYMTAPWDVLRDHVYVADAGSDGASREYRRATDDALSMPGRPRLRRTILMDGHDELQAGATRFQVVVRPTPDDQLLLRDAYRIAGVVPGGRLRFSQLLDGWVFDRSGGVTAARRGGERLLLEGVTIEALRTIDRHAAEVPIVFGDIESYEKLKRFLVTSDGVGPQMAAVPRGRLVQLMESLGDAGLTLTTVAEELTLAGREPSAQPLLAHR